MTERIPLPHRLLNIYVLITGILAAILGGLVIVGWYSHTPFLIQVLPNAVPMQYNTALGFLLSGCGLFLIPLNRKIYAQIFGGAVALIGLATLTQYVLGLNFGIDQLLMRHDIITATSQPGRMAPNTAIGFILVGIALLSAGKAKTFYRRSLLVAVVGSITFAIGAIAFFGYISHVESAYGWGNMTHMAIHTAFAFITMGAGIFLQGWREGLIESEGTPNWLAIPFGIILSAVTFFQWLVMLAQEKGAYELIYPAKKSPLPQVILAAGLVMAALITITIHQAKKLWNRSKIVDHANRELQAEIAERMRAENAMRKSQEKYRLLADNTLDCIWRMDLDFTFTYINPSVKPMFGYSPKEWIGSTLQDHCSSCNLAFIKTKISDELHHPGNQTGMVFQTELLHRDGHVIPVEVNGKSLRDEHDKPMEIQGTIRDISERKKAESEKEKLEDLLRQAQKMEAIGTLAGGIAHDFNNILGVLMGYTELSIDELPPESPVRQNLHHVLVSAERAKEMVKQILAFSRKNQVERVPVFVGPIVTEALNLLRASIPSTIAIQSNIEKEQETVLADATQLHQVIMNLGTNAAHAMKEFGGVLHVTLNTAQVNSKILNANVIGAGKYRVLTVSDTGHGINEEIQKRIFEPYFTTKPRGEGTGMGLAVVHGIVKDHGGVITLKSQHGTGATFSIYLPTSTDEKISTQPVTTNTTLLGGNECILLVDDEQVLAEMGKKMLSSLGYQVISRAGSIEALEAFRSAPEKFDLIITDQTMPNMTGIHLAREIKKIRPAIPVILCTGFSESVNEDNYKAMGVDAFVMKPIIKKHIAPVIRQILDAIRE